MNNNDYLAHHGIKGMKWGIRRFRNEDGSLTNAGKDRYYKHTIGGFYNKVRADNYRADAESARKAGRVAAAKRYERLANKYQKKSDKAQAKYDAKHPGNANRERMTKEQEAKLINRNLKIALGVGVAAAVAYVAHDKLTQEFCDKTLKAGTEIGRIDSDFNKTRKLPAEFYAATNPKDRAFYKGFFGADGSTEVVVNAKNPIKVASDRAAKKVFEEVYNSDATFRNSVQNSIKREAAMAATFGKGYVSKPRYKALMNARKELEKSDGDPKKMYRAYQSLLRLHEHRDQTFYNALRKNGYGAISDISNRDGFYRDQKQKSAKIFIDKNLVNVKSANNYTPKDAAAAQLRWFGEEELRRNARYLGAGAALGTATTYASYAARNDSKTAKKAREKSESQQTKQKQRSVNRARRIQNATKFAFGNKSK